MRIALIATAAIEVPLRGTTQCFHRLNPRSRTVAVVVSPRQRWRSDGLGFITFCGLHAPFKFPVYYILPFYSTHDMAFLPKY